MTKELNQIIEELMTLREKLMNDAEYGNAIILGNAILAIRELSKRREQ